MSKKILVVDDDHNILSLMTILLDQAGFQVITTRKPQDAVQLCRSTLPDLVITDIQMPGMNGFELLKILKEISPRTPVMMFSAMATAETRKRAEQFGADLFLEKRTEHPELINQVKLLLEKAEKSAVRYSALVADDHPQTRDFLADLLVEQGWNVERAADGEDALRRIRTSPAPFDVAFIDIVMPRLNGIAVIRAIRSAFPSTLCVAITGEAVSEEIAEAYKSGAYAVLRKPFDPEEFQKQTSTIIEEVKKLRKAVANG